MVTFAYLPYILAISKDPKTKAHIVHHVEKFITSLK